ncbi:plasmid partitioning protein RepB [Camelimonas fluminis]|uniref:Plasmid partitioning protein RepB n=1 Tax=Camelimonas fluminis TaxID=1576911 RepID=A0ABV7UBZ8_9HYPH
MKKSRSILQSFGSFSPPATDVGDAVAPVARVGAGVIGATQRTLAELRDERDRLRALVDAGVGMEMDPALIDPSPFPDRLPDDDDAKFEIFKASIATDGQQVPIQVRRHPTMDGRYQVVFGHRRLRAVSELGQKVRALVIDMTDAELIIAQGLENSSRQDLTWIERALFAARMDSAGVKPRDIKAALSIDDAEMTRLRGVTRAVPIDVIEAIGRAPKVGRPRWLKLATALDSNPVLVEQVRKTLSTDKVLALPSDRRFAVVLAETADAPNRPAVARLDLADTGGKSIGKIEFDGGAVKLAIQPAHTVNFSRFLQAELPSLVSRYLARNAEK